MGSWLSNFVGNMIAADQLIELRKLNEGGVQRRMFDWDNKIFQDEMRKTIDTFKASYPEYEWNEETIEKYLPEKEDGLKTIDKMANEGRINELEYLVLYKQILTPKGS